MFNPIVQCSEAEAARLQKIFKELVTSEAPRLVDHEEGKEPLVRYYTSERGDQGLKPDDVGSNNNVEPTRLAVWCSRSSGKQRTLLRCNVLGWRVGPV